MSWNLARRKTSDCRCHVAPSTIHPPHTPNPRCFMPLCGPSGGGRLVLRRPSISQVPSSLMTPISATSRHLSSPSEARAKQRSLDIDTIVSVLEVSATKRDAKGYLQKYTESKSKPRPGHALTVTENTPTGQGSAEALAERPAHVAIVKLRCPQYLDKVSMAGIAKTLTQLKVLGLLSIIVLDCGVDEPRITFEDQAYKLGEAFDSFSKPSSRFLGDVVTGRPPESSSSPTLSVVDNRMRVDDMDRLAHTLHNGLIPIIPSLARSDETCAPLPTDADQFILTLTKYLVGLQFKSPQNEQAPHDSEDLERSKTIASVERIIVLDPVGGTPFSGRPGASHRFVNLEQEYDIIMKHLSGPEGPTTPPKRKSEALAKIHASNLTLAKEALSILPSSSSVLITTPFAAVSTSNTRESSTKKKKSATEQWDPNFGLDGMVITRKRQNPLVHNLLTDKPVYSSSLPFLRIQDRSYYKGDAMGPSSAATLVKRGMPLTMYPDPRITPWTPPRPGEPQLRLTDRCIDLPRLRFLIEDSFNRKLDINDYLDRVNDNLAGIIIAGEYEGGAILTWECPDGLDQKTAYEQGRLVPYLDKFAVLKSRQGGGGVADVVFNAMVNDCFPDGVCWRSRKDNPVNKWYFERSTGTYKLNDSNWTMFWTTPGLNTNDQTVRDYESVCRSVEPSWLDNKHILD